MIRLVKVIVSILYLSLAAGIGRLVHASLGRRRDGCIVLLYHDLTGAQRRRFARQMDILVLLARPVVIDEDTGGGDGVRRVAVTFDDGFQSVVEHALPEIRTRRIPVTVFVPAAYIGERAGWITNPLHSSYGALVMTAEALRALPPELVTVGSHCLSHPHLPALSAAVAREEIVASRARLEALLGRRVRLMALPYGEYDARVVDWCREAEYTRVFGDQRSLPARAADGFVVPRVNVSADDWLLEFGLKVLGGYGWLPLVSRARQMLQRSGPDAAPFDVATVRERSL